MSARILLVGNYCHDTLRFPSGEARTLGGSASYVSAALAGLSGAERVVVAKVGEDFLYAERVEAKPLLARGSATTRFVNDMTQEPRTQRLEAVCEPIFARDLPLARAEVGLACGVAMEILPETVRRLRELCALVVADAQALLRAVEPDGSIFLRPLSETPFTDCLDCFDVLKASELEARFLDLPSLRARGVRVVVTLGPRGCRVIDREGETEVPSMPVEEVDSTGAGDCFVAGLAHALAQGRTLLGNRLGALAVQHVGVPDFASAAALHVNGAVSGRCSWPRGAPLDPPGASGPPR